MVTVKFVKNCDLCGQPVEIKGFSINAEKNKLMFCCAGCQSIYQLLYIPHRSTKSDTIKTTTHEDN
ncbi:MAG: heavy metal translocating P-type ATPase metal-binding domain-containing protein [Methyloglobulus sp.]|nr:metal-binding protein [Methyloglobulus sp.]